MMKIKNNGRRRLRLGVVTLSPGQAAEVDDGEGATILRKFHDISDITPKVKNRSTPKKKTEKPEETPEEKKLDLNIEVEYNDIE